MGRMESLGNHGVNFFNLNEYYWNYVWKWPKLSKKQSFKHFFSAIMKRIDAFLVSMKGEDGKILEN